MYKKILVPLDGSELSESILDHVITIATGCQVPPEVVLLRVRKLFGEITGVTLGHEITKELNQAYHHQSANYLKGIAKELEKKGIVVKTEVLTGDPAKEILKYSKNKNVDLIIMSTHGKSGFSKVVFGSVAYKILGQTKVPVLLKPAIKVKA